MRTMATTIGKENSVENIRGDISLPIGPEYHVSVVVIFTSIEQTLKALEKAEELAKDLGARIAVVAAEIVPFPAPLDQPPVPFEFVIGQFETMAMQKLGGIHIFPYLCRDQFEAYKHILNRDSPVVIGIKKRWWPTREARLARKLQRAGYKIILAETE
jgi:hypothetical protein